MQDIVIPSLMQLLVHAPVLLVYMTGIVLAFVCWRRCPTPSMLALIACVLLLGMSLLQPFVSSYLMHAHREAGWSSQKLATLFSGVNIVTSLVYAVGLALLVTATFIHRKPRDTPDLGSR